MGGDFGGSGVSGSFFEDYGFDTGDDFASAFDKDGIADTDVEASDFGEVVEGGIGDDGACDKDGLEACDGCCLTGATDLDVDAEEGCFLFFGDEFVGNGPFGGFGDPAEAILFGVGVYFEDNAVDIEGDGGARLFDEGEEVLEVLKGVDEGGEWGDAEAAGGKEGLSFGVGVEVEAFGVEDVVGIEAQIAFSGFLGVFLPHTASGGLAGVHEGFLASGDEALVVGVEVSFVHESFATNFLEGDGGESGDVVGDLVEGEGLEGDVFADAVSGVAAGNGLGEVAEAIVEGEGKAVELEFSALDGGSGRIGGVGGTVIEGEGFCFVHRVVDGQHGHGVRDFGEVGLLEVADDGLGGRRGVGIASGVGFELFDLLVGGVVDGIGNRRGVEHVVFDGPGTGLLNERFVFVGGNSGHKSSCGGVGGDL